MSSLRRRKKQTIKRRKRKKRSQQRNIQSIKARTVEYIYERDTGKGDIINRCEFAKMLWNEGLGGEERSFTIKVWDGSRWRKPYEISMGNARFIPCPAYQRRQFNDFYREGFKDQIAHPYYFFEGKIVYQSYDFNATRVHTFDYYPKVKLILAANTKLSKRQMRQAFRNGKNHCLLQPILAYFEKQQSREKKNRYGKKIGIIKKLIEEYQEGVPEDQIQNICDKLSISVRVSNFLYAALGINKPFLDVKPSKVGSLKQFRYVNTELNHVDNVDNISTQSFMVTKDELYDLRDKFDKEDINYWHSCTRKGQLTKLVSKFGTHKIKTRYHEVVGKWEEKYGLRYIGFDANANPELTEFCEDSILSQGTKDFVPMYQTDADAYTHIDQKKCYTQSHLCPFYEGFMGKITTYGKADLDWALENLGLYRITNVKCFFKGETPLQKVFEKLNYLKDGIILSTPEIKFVLSLGCITFEVVEGCWGHQSIDVRFDKEMLEEEINWNSDKRKETGVAFYAKYVGCAEKTVYTTNLFMKATDQNKKLVQDIAAKIKDDRYKVSYELDNLRITYPSFMSVCHSHFTAYIKSYARMNMLHQLALIGENGENNVLRICVDGIYCIKGKYKVDYGFREKKDGTLGNHSNPSYVIGKNVRRHTFLPDVAKLEYDKVFEDEEDEECYFEYSFPDKHCDWQNRLLLKGAGGTGKSHLVLTHKCLVKPIVYLSPTHNLAYKKSLEFDCISIGGYCNLFGRTRKDLITKHWYVSNFCVDEVSMMTERPIGKVQMMDTRYHINREVNKGCRVLWLGDDLQLPPVNDGIPFDWDKEIQCITLTKNYRFKCRKLKRLAKDIRALMRCNAPSSHIIDLVRKTVPTVSLPDIQYNPMNDFILASKNNICDNITSYFKDKVVDKWKICNNNHKNKLFNGMYVVGEKPQTGSPKLCHCSTIHCIQGDTLSKDGKLYIYDGSLNFLYQLLYTAISRARRLDQIFLLKF